jgi:biopolymer transport protein ExbD
MRVPSSHSSASGDIGSSMTPMIDVVFQLLIYFLCTASFAMSEQILPTTLPPTGTAATYTPPPELQELELIRITLQQRGAELIIELNGQPCPDVATLTDRLRQILALANLPVVLDVAADVELGHMINIYDICLLVGLHDIHFAAPE